jgi:DNA-binding NtrC family response regulator
VDDEETIHKALQRTLRREPYDILHAYDAAEASAILDAHRDVAAVICDHYMPGTHGLELLMRLRKTFPDLVTILLTAQADLDLVLSAINEGRIHRFFTKPWDAVQLRGQLRELLFGVSPDDAQREREAQVEDRLRRELLPRQDETTGAFIIDADD